jgi:bacteriorhodopsin
MLDYLVVSQTKLIFSFTLTYILLITTTTITFIEALGTSNSFIRHIFNLETLISIVAGYFYSKFIDKINKCIENKEPLDWDELTLTRYLDWSITTPLMLLVLMAVLCYHSKQKLSFKTYLLVFVLNYVMLYTGYKGEYSKIENKNNLGSGSSSNEKDNAMWIISYIAFFVMYYVIYVSCVGKGIFFNNFLFTFYLIVWILYGVAYRLDNETKNIMYNYLDLISKCLVGIGLWVYFSKLLN